MKTRLINIVLWTTFILAMVGCEPVKTETGNAAGVELLTGGAFQISIFRYHDDEKGVTCWISNGISCLPDSQLKGGGE